MARPDPRYPWPPPSGPPSQPPARTPGVGYWALVGGLFAFGVLGIFTIGLPLILLGLALVVASPFRARPRLFWAIIGAVASFIVAFILVAPLGCTSMTTSVAPSAGPGAGSVTTVGPTTCGNLLGIRYSGGPNFSPPYLPALLAGLAGAGFTTTVVAVLLRNRAQHGF